MGKVIALILFALSAKANAEDTLSILVDRATGGVEGIEVDLDEATLAKPAKAGGAKKTAAAPRTVKKTTSSGKRGAVGPRKGTFTPINTQKAPQGRVFGGTNKLMAGAGKAIQQGAATPSYWGGKNDAKGIGFGWSVGGKKVNTVTTEVRQLYKPPSVTAKKFNAIKGKDTAPKRLFGGTNTLMAGKGQAIQEDPATPSYWGGKKSDKGIGYGWFSKGAKAVPESQTGSFMARPVAPRLGLTQPQIAMGRQPGPMARPFLLENQTRDIAFSDIFFFVGAISLISFAVLKISRRGALAREQATDVA
eukprot:gnl/MRDRNA2_/MRDRNA2_85657_c0_seq1.p1 gnl/MRDRNA2_/MRDRNA2_85657_c0~~gnl/MRDRNA2_/MRDRNA2_85657_c0_seq1.p1  ORF type:complete len:305 (+),score=65.84 gnl/MRDRNA2_/MRDRNA2_85657_c0_seq1:109-1023(+)